MVSRSADREARARRAEELARLHPVSSEPLAFFIALTGVQARVCARQSCVLREASCFDSALDLDAIQDVIPAFLHGIHAIAPPPLQEAAGDVLREGADAWRRLVRAFWHGDRDADMMRAFLVEALLQPFAEAAASLPGVAARPRADASAARCGICGDLPVVAVLRDAAQGARRSLVCGFCLSEWPVPRVVCPSCGETRFDKLAVYRAEGVPAVRVDACESCRTYIKTVDLTSDGRAIPVVDDLATVALDLWARDREYERLRANLLRL